MYVEDCFLLSDNADAHLFSKGRNSRQRIDIIVPIKSCGVPCVLCILRLFVFVMVMPVLFSTCSFYTSCLFVHGETIFHIIKAYSQKEDVWRIIIVNIADNRFRVFKP